MSGPCDDLRVIDLSSGPAGGVATMVLGDFGADVIKIERPGGDPLRRLPSAPMWLRGKRSAVLDLTEAGDRARLHELVAGADVVVASFRPGRAEALGADHATLSAINPRLVYCSITGWGPRGPYAQYPADEAIVSAKTGRMRSFFGFAPRPAPYFSPLQVGVHGAAQSAITGILAALFARDRLGAGQLVETSLLQGQFPQDLFGLVRTQLQRDFAGEFPPPAPAPARITLQYLPVMASDGRWIQFANLVEHLFHAMIAAVGLSEIYGDPRFATAPTLANQEDHDALRTLILERVRERPADEWMEIFRANGNVAAEPFETPQRALSNTDLLVNGEVVETEHPRLGRLRQLGPLARLTVTPGAVGGPEPLLGEHTSEVLAEAPRAPSAPPAASGNGAGAPAPRHPLEGVTVVEFATVIAVPLGASLLADLGARVIKVESLEGDPHRGMGVGLGAYVGASKTTAGKDSICIDLKAPEGQRIAQQIIERSDILIHNFRPGVPERLGIGYEQARALRPDIIYIPATGYGPDGPSAHRPAAHPIPGAACGGALFQAGRDGAPSDAASVEELREGSGWLYGANETSPDPNTSVVLASAAMLGLHARRRTGEGQQIFLSMLGANAYANYDDFLSYEGKRERPTVDADVLGFSALYRLYPARSGWVMLAVSSDAQWPALCAALGRPDLASDPRFATAEDRREADDALSEVLTELLAAKDADTWEAELIPAGVPCVRADVHMPGTFLRDEEHMQANGFANEAEHAIWGPYQRWGPTVTFSGTPGRYGPGVLAGEQTDSILEELGYGAADIADLRARRVVTSEQPMALAARA